MQFRGVARVAATDVKGMHYGLTREGYIVKDFCEEQTF